MPELTDWQKRRNANSPSKESVDKGAKKDTGKGKAGSKPKSKTSKKAE